MVITANFLAVALGGIFDRSSQLLTSDIMVTYPFTTSTNTEIPGGDIGSAAVWTFATEGGDHWVIVNSNVIEGTDLPPWVTDEFYFLPFEWEQPRNKSGLRTSITQGYGGNLTCWLLAGDTFQQSTQMEDNVVLTFRINVTVPISDGGSVRCWNELQMDPRFLKKGAHPLAVEWVRGLSASDTSDQKAVQACRNFILAGWSRGEGGLPELMQNLTSPPMKSNTTIICSQQISTGEFRVTVDGEGRVKRSKLIGELRYDDPRIFNASSSVGNFKAQLAWLFISPRTFPLSYPLMHNDNSSHSFSQFLGEHLINKMLSDPATPSPSFEDAQLALSKLYKIFFTILLTQNQDRIFVPAGNVRRSAIGKLESLKPRMSMDPAMFYIAVVILGFQLIAGVIIFALTPRRFLPRFPYNLVSEIGFFYSSNALSDLAGTANMSSAMRSRHLRRLGGTYGYGRFRGSDGKSHIGIERMSLIRNFKEAMHGRE